MIDSKAGRGPTSLDELSIDSKTDKKIHITRQLEQNSDQQDEKHPRTTMTTKPHFRIDWRQLTYYQKEQRSLLGGLWRRPARAGHSDIIYELQEELRQEQEQDNCRFSRLSSLGSGGSEAATHSPQPRPRRRPILNGLDGCFKSGELNAILGPSGAGKSTFLSALFGNKQESSYGQTKVTWFTSPHSEHHHHHHTNKSHPEAQNTKRSIRIAFLPQHDHLLNHLSVQETLMFASKIKNPQQASDSPFHRQNVKRVAKMLKLTDCFQTRCGRLSGGQYKRVSIGQELLSEPDVIILDEPTSGLDAMTCLTTIRTLKSIVLKHPISIILTIHQPDIDVFNLFDQVYVIAQGGMAIYEGPPQDVVSTLAQVNLLMPSENYNPARFIVENAFVADLDAVNSSVEAGSKGVSCDMSTTTTTTTTSTCALVGPDDGAECKEEDSSGADDDEEDSDEQQKQKQSFIRRSISSLTEALAGGGLAKQVELRPSSLLPGGKANNAKLRDSGRRPLLNIGIQTADGKLITSEQLGTGQQQKHHVSKTNLQLESQLRRQQLERLKLLRGLNQMQREKYYSGSSAMSAATLTSGNRSSALSDILSQQTSLNSSECAAKGPRSTTTTVRDGSDALSSASSSGGDSSSWSEAKETIEELDEEQLDKSSILSSRSSSSRSSSSEHRASHFIVNFRNDVETGGKIGNGAGTPADDGLSAASTMRLKRTRLVAGGSHITEESTQLEQLLMGAAAGSSSTTTKNKRLRRQFDKRLSARHIQSKQRDYPIWYHAFLLTHRTWLSIVRDPIFFGIQFTMHTTIPILLALIFGSQQEEGCPQVGNFDLVQFAYSSQVDFIDSTMRSIRQSVGNIGIIFFEMFVLSFAINCITALVFPLDMYVLLKEYRNGWYSLRSYFFGRTLADLPVPIVLHSIAMSILYYMTGQPLIWWRFLAIIGIVILASLVAQSVGLTIGALLMRSSQSAVLAAAGIVAPFFALSGFIVRIHTLPWVAQWAAQGSYLYHLLNGFIIMRYGFERCSCSEEDFELDESHRIPANIRTMASMWIGTYSHEFDTSAQMMEAQNHHPNRTNLDPNIDLIDKLMSAFKMANSFGHKVETCDDVLPYAMLDFSLKDVEIWHSCLALVVMLIISRFITFGAIYYKIRSFS